jgi:hypothetical protein
MADFAPAQEVLSQAQNRLNQQPIKPAPRACRGAAVQTPCPSVAASPGAAIWSHNCCGIGMLERCLFCSVGVLLLASVGAFFFYVPILTLTAALLIILALILMFSLGVYFGRGSIIASRTVSDSQESPQLEPTDTCKQPRHPSGGKRQRVHGMATVARPVS